MLFGSVSSDRGSKAKIKKWNYIRPKGTVNKNITITMPILVGGLYMWPDTRVILELLGTKLSLHLELWTCKMM